MSINKIINKLLALIATLMTNHSIQIFCLVAIGFFLRSSNLGQNLYFGYDQGRDALIINNIIEQKKPVLIGATTGIQGVFLGPFFYYLLLPFYYFGQGDPAYPAIWLAFLGALSIYFIYLLGRDIFNHRTGLIAATFLTVSSLGILYSRTLFNPSPIIPISLLMFWLVFKVKQGQKNLLPWVGLLLGLSLQTELANAFFLIPVIIIYLFREILTFKFKHFFFAFILFFLTLAPQIIFDFRHEHLISNAILNNFFSDANKTSLQDIWQKRPTFLAQWIVNIFGTYGSFVKKYLFFYVPFLIIIFLMLPWKIPASLDKKNKSGLILLQLWLFIPLISYLFYTGNYGLFFDYYLISLFIPPILLVSHIIISLKKRYYHGHTMAVSLASIIFLLNLLKADTFIQPDRLDYSLNRLIQTVDYVLLQAKPNEVVWTRTPNGISATYEYLFKWRSKITHKPNIDLNIVKPADSIFLIYEPDEVSSKSGELIPRDRFLNWYYPLIKDKQLVKKDKFGIITVEYFQSTNYDL